jgi:hypothetical protein
MPKRLIQNNQGGILTLQMAGKPLADGSVQLGALVDIPPGVKPIDVSMWNVLKAHPVVKLLLKERIAPSFAPEQDARMVGRYKLVEGPEVADTNPLESMKPTDALKVVQETLDTATLDEWLLAEKREGVRKAITKQMALINEPMLGRGAAGVPQRGANTPGDDGGDELGGGAA